MSKTASIFFAVTSVVWMIATAVSLSYNFWLALFFLILTFLNIGAGFIWKARSRKARRAPQN